MKGGTVGFLLTLGISFASPDGIVLTALTYMERPYQFGANQIYRMDCSAFVQRVYEANGIRLPRTTVEQANVGSYVDIKDIKPGDLLFYTTYKSGPSHVGIYIGKGKMIHAAESTGITISRIDDPYWQKRFLFAKRVIGTAPTKPELKQVKSEPKQVKQVYVQSSHRDEIGDLIFILASRK